MKSTPGAAYPLLPGISLAGRRSHLRERRLEPLLPRLGMLARISAALPWAFSALYLSRRIPSSCFRRSVASSSARRALASLSSIMALRCRASATRPSSSASPGLRARASCHSATASAHLPSSPALDPSALSCAKRCSTWDSCRRRPSALPSSSSRSSRRPKNRFAGFFSRHFSTRRIQAGCWMAALLLADQTNRGNGASG